MSKVVGKIVITGILENKSPFVIGSGKGDIIDVEILKDEKGNPYIPATSFVGALRHHLESNFLVENEESFNQFWGFVDADKRNVCQSHFTVSDLKLIGKKDGSLTGIRDGVAIVAKTGIAREKAKYDYEIVNRDLNFRLQAELTLREGFNKEMFLKILKTALSELEQGKVCLGALTTKGFGRFFAKEIKVYSFEFPRDGEKYLQYLASSKKDKFSAINLADIPQLIPKETCDFVLKASFSIKSSLIISSYTTDPKDPDKVHIKYNDKPVLPGTSLKGVIKARSVKIVQTLLEGREENFIQEIKNKLDDLFGFADTENETGKKIKSRMIVEESIIENIEEAEQTRIKIDRFTGGVVERKLFQSKPIWHKEENINLCITIKNAKNWEVGLLLLVLKDLWNEDLPIGGEKNIGRGILIGKEALLKHGKKEYFLKRKNDKELEIKGSKDELEDYVKSLLQELGVE
ncbi:RAMP superfamily CRISPR-associated protein [Thermosyntropha sp.]|uniref:RAMP superfamily CRISPR-associated protein n=1 Tax=Thermosyntropha sp. TaxID=2740820 RepID=UPI0025CD6435|nr:RAMP superfamily CRISPR-associated protein [Thermosyntropha sp.]